MSNRYFTLCLYFILFLSITCVLRAGDEVSADFPYEEINNPFDSENRPLKEEIAMLNLSEYAGRLRNFLGVVVINNLPPYGLVPYGSPYRTPSVNPYPPVSFTSFSLKSNLETEWKLMRNGRIFYSDRGSLDDIPIPAAPLYYIIARDVPGYTLYKTPTGSFNAIAGRPVRAELYY